MKKIKTTDTDITVNTSTALIVEIGSLSFEVDERFPWVSVYLNSDKRKELIDEIDEDDTPTIVEHQELKRVALNWYFSNVEIVSEEEMEVKKIKIEEEERFRVERI